MVRGERVVEMDKSEEKDLEPYYRLIEMQKQMIDLIQQNAHAERECAALRERLAREVEALARSRRTLPERLRESATGLMRRFMRRNGNNGTESTASFPMGWPHSVGGRGKPSSTQRAGPNT
jgi:hypothetical protein